jgi:hypothetical protein
MFELKTCIEEKKARASNIEGVFYCKRGKGHGCDSRWNEGLCLQSAVFIAMKPQVEQPKDKK